MKAPGVNPLYKPYGHVPPQRVRFFTPTGIDLANFDLHSAMAYEGTTCVYQFQVNIKESVICKFEMDLKIFLLRF